MPESYRERAIHGVDDETGHMGVKRNLELARARFYCVRVVINVCGGKPGHKEHPNW